MFDELALLPLIATTPMVGAECFFKTFGPNFDAPIGNHTQRDRFYLKFFHPIGQFVRVSTRPMHEQINPHQLLAGLGYSIMPLIGIRNELQSGAIKIIPVEGLPIHTAWQLIWLKGKNLSPVAKAYLQHVEMEKERIAGLYFTYSM